MMCVCVCARGSVTPSLLAHMGSFCSCSHAPGDMSVAAKLFQHLDSIDAEAAAADLDVDLDRDFSDSGTATRSESI